MSDTTLTSMCYGHAAQPLNGVFKAVSRNLPELNCLVSEATHQKPEIGSRMNTATEPVEICGNVLCIMILVEICCREASMTFLTQICDRLIVIAGFD